jgi:hypothetical protein
VISVKFVYCCVLFTLRTFEAVTVCRNFVVFVEFTGFILQFVVPKTQFFFLKVIETIEIVEDVSK